MQVDTNTENETKDNNNEKLGMKKMWFIELCILP